MKPLHTRQHLIDLIAADPITKAMGTAITRGRVEVLGGFKAVDDLPSYVVRITSERNTVWLVQVLVDSVHYRYIISTISGVQWDRWLGSWSSRRPLIDGDCPATYGYLRMMSRRKV